MFVESLFVAQRHYSRRHSARYESAEIDMPIARNGTAQAIDIIAPVSGLGLWARKNRPAIAQARARFDAAARKL